MLQPKERVLNVNLHKMGVMSVMTAKFTKEDEYVIAGPILPNGRTVALHHSKDDKYTVGEITNQVTDKSLLLKSNPGTPYFNVLGTVDEIEHLASGPAKVTSNAYRIGWDQIFGSRKPVGQA